MQMHGGTEPPLPATVLQRLVGAPSNSSLYYQTKVQKRKLAEMTRIRGR